MWIYLGLLAALFLGLHNLFKKHAVQGNEVFPVLFGTISSGFLLILPFYFGSILYPEYMQKIGFYITDITWRTHGFILVKSMIMRPNGQNGWSFYTLFFMWTKWLVFFLVISSVYFSS
jgi:transporter family protein